MADKDVELMIQRPVIDKENGIVINGNFEEVKEMVKSKVEEFKGLTLNEDNLKEVKDAKMQFTHLRTGIDRERKQYEALYITPLADNINRLCDDIQKVVAEGEGALHKQLDEYDQKRKDELTEVINMYINEAAAKYGIIGNQKYMDMFAIKKSFYNKGTKEADIVKDINEQAEIIGNRYKERCQAEKRIFDACEGTALVAEQYIQLLDYGRTAFEVLDMIDEAKEKAEKMKEELQQKVEKGEKVVIGNAMPSGMKISEEDTAPVRHIYQFTMDKEDVDAVLQVFGKLQEELGVVIRELKVK